MLGIRKPTEDQSLMFSAINRELKERTQDSLTDVERSIIVGKFVSDYDFSNAALAHKTPSGWAKLIMSKLTGSYILMRDDT